MTRIPRIQSVKAGGHTLQIVWEDGATDSADLSAVVRRFKPFAPLQNKAAFADVSVVAHGSGIEWGNGLDYSAYRLKQIADLQREASADMTPEEFCRWQADAGLTVPLLAKVLGMGERQIIKYRTGKAAIPRAIQLTVRQFEREPGILNALLPKVSVADS